MLGGCAPLGAMIPRMQWRRFIDQQEMFNGNLALHGIDRDLRHKERQNPTLIIKGEAIKILPDFLPERGKLFHQSQVPVLLLVLMFKMLPFSLNALNPRTDVVESRRDFFSGDTSDLVQI